MADRVGVVKLSFEHSRATVWAQFGRLGAIGPHLGLSLAVWAQLGRRSGTNGPPFGLSLAVWAQIGRRLGAVGPPFGRSWAAVWA